MTRSSGDTGVDEDLVNDPVILAKLHAFRARVDRMESQMEQLTRNYPDQWIALHTGDFVIAESLDGLLEKLEGLGMPTPEAVVRFLDSNPKKMIL